MKVTIKQVSIIGVMLLTAILATSFVQKDNATKILTVRVFEMGIGSKMKISICDETGKAEDLIFDKVTSDNQLLRTEKLNQTLNDIAKRNYQLVSATGGDFSSTFIFERK